MCPILAGGMQKKKHDVNTNSSSMKKITKRLSVMLADDDSDDRDVFHHALRSVIEQCDFKTFINGEEVVAYFKQPDVVPPDILFLDINMPMMGGLEVLQTLRKELGMVHLAIGIYSTSSRESDIQTALIRGANIYIKKTTSITDLKESLQKVLNMNIQMSDRSMETFVLYV